MQITMQRTRLSWPAKTKLRMTPDCSRIAKETAMMSGLEVCKMLTRYKEFDYKWGFFGEFKTNLFIYRVISFHACSKFSLWLGNSAWDFFGEKFWSTDFFGFLFEAQGTFFGF